MTSHNQYDPVTVQSKKNGKATSQVKPYNRRDMVLFWRMFSRKWVSAAPPVDWKPIRWSSLKPMTHT